MLGDLHTASGTLFGLFLLLDLGCGNLLSVAVDDEQLTLLRLDFRLDLVLGQLGRLLRHFALDELNYLLEGPMLAHELKGGFGTDTLDRLEVVTT